MAERRDVDNIGVARVNAHLADVARRRQTTVGPRCTTIGRLIDPITVRDINADGRFAHTDVDRAGIGFRDGDGTNRRGLKVTVGNIDPGGTGVVRFPDATGDPAKVVGGWVNRIAGHRDNAPAARWANTAPGHRIKQLLGKRHAELLFRGWIEWLGSVM